MPRELTKLKVGKKQIDIDPYQLELMSEEHLIDLYKAHHPGCDEKAAKKWAESVNA